MFTNAPFFLVLQDERGVLPPNSEATSVATFTGDASAATHGIEVAIEFKPPEHPTEPLDNDQPIQCPLPKPSILNVSFKVCFTYGIADLHHSWVFV